MLNYTVFLPTRYWGLLGDKKDRILQLNTPLKLSTTSMSEDRNVHHLTGFDELF
jgi:hypothetical protein